jgi:hypothetical protein
VIVKTAANGGVQYRRLGIGVFPEAPTLEPPMDGEAGAQPASE